MPKAVITTSSRSVASSDEVGPTLLKLLGIDTNLLVTAVITIKAQTDIMVEAEYYASMDLNEAGELEMVMKEFAMVELEDPEALEKTL